MAAKGKMAKNVNLKKEPEDNYKSSTIKGKGDSKKKDIADSMKGCGSKKKK